MGVGLLFHISRSLKTDTLCEHQHLPFSDLIMCYIWLLSQAGTMKIDPHLFAQRKAWLASAISLRPFERLKDSAISLRPFERLKEKSSDTEGGCWH